MNKKQSKYSRTIQASTAESSFSGILSVLLFIFGIYIGFESGWIEGSILIIGSIVLIGVISAKKQKSLLSRFESRCRDLGLEYKPHHSDPERDLLIGISENDGTVLAWCRVSDYEIYEKYIDLHDVLNVELSLDDNAIYKAGPIAALSAAAIGGAAFGGAGAIVGSLTTNQVGKGKISSLVLKLLINDIDTPMIQIPFVLKPIKLASKDGAARLEIAEKWTNLIEVMRHRIAERNQRQEV